MAEKRRRRLRDVPINRMIPNMVTMIAFAAGLTGIKFALEGRWGAAVLAIFAATVADGLDGRIARLLKGSSKFGAELDSLSDCVAFGVAPAIIVYLWAMEPLGGIGWIAGLLYASCAALRLARFNTALEDPDPPAWASRFFTGVAAPAGAALALLPMMFALGYDLEVLQNPVLNLVWILFIGYLMISRIATYSIKKVRVPHRHVMPTLLVAGLGTAGLVIEPFRVLSGIAFFYLLTIPFAMRAMSRHRQEQGLGENSVADSLGTLAVDEQGEEEDGDESEDSHETPAEGAKGVSQDGTDKDTPKG